MNLKGMSKNTFIQVTIPDSTLSITMRDRTVNQLDEAGYRMKTESVTGRLPYKSMRLFDALK